jgi:hypothetical protein
MHIITGTFPSGHKVTHKILRHHVDGPHGWLAIIENFKAAGIPFTHVFMD